jgi:competence protein ComEC
MITIHEIPALRILAGMIIGIFLFPFFDELSSAWIVILSIFSIASLILTFKVEFGYNERYLSSLFLLIPTISVTILYIYLSDVRHSDDHLVHHLFDNKVYVMAKCVEAPKKGKSWQIVMNAQSFINKGRSYTLRGKFILYCKELNEIPAPGESFRVHVKLDTVRSPDIPKSFDYRTYLARQDIYKIGYIQKEDLKKVGEAPLVNIKNWAYQIRNWSIDRCTRLLGENELADVASGLIFGYRDKIDATTQRAFVNTGSVHLLAVSGMHVVLIYSNVILLLGLLQIRKLVGKKNVPLLALVFLWVFTFVAGLAASIVRATLMITIMVIGKYFGRQGINMNTVCAVAVIMLIYDPNVLYDVGFQLSFAAVVGILTFQQPVKQYFPEWLLLRNGFSNMISVTIAAQLTTLPLILYYFHQFPVYFMLSGIIAVFLADWVIKIGLAVILISIISSKIAVYFSLLWQMSVWSLLKSVAWIDRIPHGLISAIYFPIESVMILSFMLILTMIQCNSKVKHFKTLLMTGIFLLIIIDGASIYKATGRVGYEKYSINGKQVAIERKGFDGIVWADKALDSSKVMERLSGYMISERIIKVQYKLIPTENDGYIPIENEVVNKEVRKLSTL